MDLLAFICVVVVLWLLLVRGKSQSAAQSVGNSFMGGGVAGGTAGAAASFASNSDPDSVNKFSDLLNAITHMEGGRPGDRNVRNNNPMDIEYGAFAKRHGAVGSDGRFAIFPDWDSGQAAMAVLVKAKVNQNPDWDFYDLFNYFLRGSTTAPPVDKEGDSNAYAEYVAGALGVEPTQPVYSVVS
jgi:hypothetical protein